MARINIEDQLFIDGEFTELAIKMGSRRMALGAIVEAYILAQKFYLSTDNDRLIPLIEWKRSKIADEIIEVGLAEVREKGVYVRGSDKQFGWLVQRSEAGKAKKTKKDESTDERSLSVDERSIRDGNGSKPLTLTLTPTLTHSLDINNTNVVDDDGSLDNTAKVDPISQAKNFIVAKQKFDLEPLYQLYPKKEGKKVGMDRLKRIVTSQEKYDQVAQAIINYTKSKSGEPIKYLKQFSSFVSVWEDYISIQQPATSGSEKMNQIKNQIIHNPYNNGG